MRNRKSLGQHWLKDRQILNQIAQLAIPNHANLPTEQYHCLEIGPGLGTLTSALFRIFPEITAVELDDRLAYNLPNSFPGKNLHVINANFLDFDLNLIPNPYVVCANIPYYITSPIIQKLLHSVNSPAKIVLLIQKEVAERIVALDEKHSMLSISVQNLAEVKLALPVDASFFTPPPKVDSAVITLIPRPQPVISDFAQKIASLGFSSPRKKLFNNLAQHFDQELLKNLFEALVIDDCTRAADIPLEFWQDIADFIIDNNNVAQLR